MATRKQSSDPSRRPLSRERILESAVEVVRRDGVEALSMRRLAEELNVWPMSLYRYFQDKETLLEAVIATVAEGVRMPPAGRPWRDHLRELMNAYREAFALDPVGLASVTAGAFLSPSMLRLSEEALATLVDAGFSDADAARGWRALWSYTYGFTLFRIGSSGSDTARRARVAVAGVSEVDYPALAAAGTAFAAAFADDDSFDYGLDRLLDGLEALLPQSPATP